MEYSFHEPVYLYDQAKSKRFHYLNVIAGLSKLRKKRKPYHSINSQVRRALLFLVKDRNYSIKEAAFTLNITIQPRKQSFNCSEGPVE